MKKKLLQNEMERLFSVDNTSENELSDLITQEVDVVRINRQGLWQRVSKGIHIGGLYLGLGVVALQFGGCSDNPAVLPDAMGDMGKISDTTPSKIKLKGSFQKGPFIQGSLLSINMLDAQGDPDGTSFSGQIKNNLGEFDLVVNKKGNSEIIGQGFYFNEVTGKLSSAQIALKALYAITDNTSAVKAQDAGTVDGGVDGGLVDSGLVDAGFLSGQVSPKINVLTHMSYSRVKKLMKENNLKLDKAAKNAEKELRSKLVIKHPFENTAGQAIGMDQFGGDTADNEYLAAVSCMLTQAAYIKSQGSKGGIIDANLQDITNRISAAIKDGSNIPTDIETLLKQAIKTGNPDTCKKNLEKRLSDTGLKGYSVADPSKAWDTDGDGIPNYTDTDDDGDGVLDLDDADPLDPKVGAKVYCKGALCWEAYPSAAQHTLTSATKYCETAKIDANTDWRVPTIDEVRTLITGCSATENGGSCKVSESCADISCYTSDCTGCQTKPGCYMEPSLSGPCNLYISSTQTNDKNNPDTTWAVDFSTASIHAKNNQVVRCVRTKQK